MRNRTGSGRESYRLTMGILPSGLVATKEGLQGQSDGSAVVYLEGIRSETGWRGSTPESLLPTQALSLPSFWGTTRVCSTSYFVSYAIFSANAGLPAELCMKSRKSLPGVVLFLLVIFLPTHNRALQTDIVITIALHPMMNTASVMSLLNAFEEENEGVDVEIANVNPPVFAPAAYYGLDAYFNGFDSTLMGVSEYVSSADVLYISSTELSVEATRAGYFLDLLPLINADPAMDIPDYYPAIFRSFEWDGGFWAIPVSGSVALWIYDTAAFEAAGIAPPDANWSLEDFNSTVTQLYEFKRANNLVSPAFSTPEAEVLFRIFANRPFYDQTVVPNPPRLESLELEAVLETWLPLRSAGAISTGFSTQTAAEIPMLTLSNIFLLTNPQDEETPRWFAPALLPNNTAAVDVNGFAISSGTPYPEIAYRLATFLSRQPEVAMSLFDDIPATRRMTQTLSELGYFGQRNMSEEIQLLVEQSVEVALPASEFRFADYALIALDSMISDEIDSRTALQRVQAEAMANLAQAENVRSTASVSVLTPVPTADFSAEEVQLTFGVDPQLDVVMTQADLAAVIREFVDADPQVGAVSIVTLSSLLEAPAETDCFYLPFNAVSRLDTTLLRDVGPLLEADPAFARTATVLAILSQLQRDGKTWAVPLILKPDLLWYNAQIFNDLGFGAIDVQWTVEDFNLALQRYSTLMDQPFLSVSTSADTDLLLLIAAFGGLPLDYRSNPPRLNLNDPQTVNAIQQVLDLVVQGQIEYTNALPDIQNLPLLSSASTASIAIDPSNDTLRPVPFPKGTQYVALSYTLETAYITAGTPYPEACYRWIRALSGHPDLLGGIPVDQALLADPVVATSLDRGTLAIYHYIADLLSSTDTVVIPNQFALATFPSLLIERLWLERAFENYMFQSADLTAELEQVEQSIIAYRDCIGADYTSASAESTSCALQVDPTLAADPRVQSGASP
jgi:ABC-type glycerol-3-phosphate transport system substrate-binding protein